MKALISNEIEEAYSLTMKNNSQYSFNKLRILVMTVYQRLVENCHCNQAVYIIYILIELFFILLYPLSLNNSIIYDLSNDIYSVKDYFNRESIFYAYIIVISLITLYVIVFFIFLLYQTIVTEDRHTNQWFYEIYSFFILNLIYVFTSPCLAILIIAFPIGGSLWYDLDFIKKIFAIIGAIVFILIIVILNFLSIFFFHEEQLNSEMPWSMNPLVFDFMKLLKKLIVAFYEMKGEDNNIYAYLRVVLLLYVWVEFIYLMWSPNLGKKWPQFALITAESVQVMVYTSCIMNNIFGIIVVDYCLLLLVLIPLNVVGSVYFKQQKKYDLLNFISKELLSINQFTVYIRNLLNLCDSHENSIEHSYLMGYLQNHIKSCNSKECFCRNTMDDTAIVIKNESNRTSTAIYELCVHYIQEALIKFGRYPKLYLLNAYAHFYLCKNDFQALYDLQEAIAVSPNIYEEFLIHRLYSIIERSVIDKESKEVHIGMSAMKTAISFQEQFINFEDLLTNAANLYTYLWKELLRDLPSYYEVSKHS